MIRLVSAVPANASQVHEIPVQPEKKDRWLEPAYAQPIINTEILALRTIPEGHELVYTIDEQRPIVRLWMLPTK
jgi:hypothetical protein